MAFAYSSGKPRVPPLCETVASTRPLQTHRKHISSSIMAKNLLFDLRGGRSLFVLNIGWRCGGVKTIRIGACHVSTSGSGPLKEWSGRTVSVSTVVFGNMAGLNRGQWALLGGSTGYGKFQPSGSKGRSKRLPTTGAHLGMSPPVRHHGDGLFEDLDGILSSHSALRPLAHG